MLETPDSALGSAIHTLVEDRLYALQNVFALNGRASAYPADAAGHSVCNCYLLKEGDRALLLDSGLAAHAASLISQVASLIDPGTRLSVYPLRINEFMSVGNVEALAEAFDLEQCYSSNADAALWVDFGGRSDRPGVRAEPVKTTMVQRSQRIHVGDEARGRALEAFQAPIRLIGTRWIYDERTRTLFTSDSFSWEWSASVDGPWSIDDAHCHTTAAHVRSFLLNTRYWWLEGGDTATLRRKLAAVFDRYDIENLAPGYGRVMRGRALVERQYRLLDQVLAGLDRSVVRSRYVDRDELR
jgi:glyoxylase-like metal-dependent hydrolase (beta-lactamase superfamily II)